MSSMLLDTLTAILVFTAGDEIAARQFLKELTHRTDESVPGTGQKAVFDYQRAVLTKACAVSGLITGRDVQGWVEGLF